jgi:Fic family protein
MALQLVAEGYLSSPVLFLSPFFARRRDQYYALLRGVSERSDWEEWLEFFLNAVVVQARDGLNRTQRLLDLQRAYRQRLDRAPRSAVRLVDLLFTSPAVTIGGAAEQLGVTWATANAAINMLQGQGVLREATGQRRDRVFVAVGVVDTINEELPEDWTLITANSGFL